MGWLAVPGITVYLVIGQVILWCLEVFAGYPIQFFFGNRLRVNAVFLN